MKQVKKILSVLMAVFLLAMLGGCGTPSAPSEREVESALQNSSAFFDNFDSTSCTVDEFAIMKRQTNEESGTDTVWVQVAARDEDKSAQLSYIMKYVLYNDGWELENISPNMESTWQFKPLRGPSDELITQSISIDLGDATVETNLEESSADVSYTVTNDRGFCITTYAKRQTSHFNADTGVWIPTDNQTVATQNDFSPIIGTTWGYLKETDYKDRDSGKTIYVGARLELNDINSETLEATGKLTVYREYHPYGASATAWYFQGGSEVDLSDGFFSWNGESLIMDSSSKTDYKGLEFRSEGDGLFSIIAIDSDGGHREYTLEKIG